MILNEQIVKNMNGYNLPEAMEFCRLLTTLQIGMFAVRAAVSGNPEDDSDKNIYSFALCFAET